MYDLHDLWTSPRVSKERKVIFFADSDTSFGLIQSLLDAWIFQSGDFCANNRRQTNQLLDPLCMRVG